VSVYVQIYDEERVVLEDIFLHMLLLVTLTNVECSSACFTG
jgi:hypothetical protein